MSTLKLGVITKFNILNNEFYIDFVGDTETAGLKLINSNIQGPWNVMSFSHEILIDNIISEIPFFVVGEFNKTKRISHVVFVSSSKSSIEKFVNKKQKEDKDVKYIYTVSDPIKLQ